VSNLHKTETLTLDERHVVFALLQGYTSDKEILHFLNDFSLIKLSSISYAIKKLHSYFGTSQRSDLCRKLSTTDYMNYVPIKACNNARIKKKLNITTKPIYF
jgi:hypothetical protein